MMLVESAAPMPSQHIRAIRIIDRAWEELRRGAFVQSQLGVTPSTLPDVSFEAARRRSEVGSAILSGLTGLEESGLPHDLALLLRLVRFHATSWARQADWYWTVVDPLGVGFFGLFLPTAYCGGFLFSTVHSQLASFAFLESGDLDRYLALVSDYARLVDQFTLRTAGQAERGMLIPKAQVAQARALLIGQRAAARAALSVSPERLRALSGGDFPGELAARITDRVEPAFDRASNGLSDEYLAQAPETVGLGQYPGGREIYGELVKLHTTLDLTPEQVHARGHERLAGIEASMEAIRAELGFVADRDGFVLRLQQDPRWRAGTVEDVTAIFQRYIERLEPRLPEYFRSVPRAPCGVAPLPSALQGSMTYGYYDAPRKGHPEGQYLFNAGNLIKQPLYMLGALTYHELMPGHHLHFATQHELESLHGLQKYGFVTAFNEGWAEYAAELAGEMGLYEEPEERYGRLVMDAFLTTRLVVDTGMNALGWSLERARDYLRAHSGMTEAEIVTESIRYSCDIPGQALAYKLGDSHIIALRERVRRKLGAHYSIKDFHFAVLGSGALPMEVLDWHVEHEVGQRPA